tara:strand:- start:316 stop:1767 length:1452 start_codon:yes stop_codon:yes gene_type:complete
MALLNQYGSPIRSRFARSVNADPWRGIVFGRRDDAISKLIPSGDRRTLAALSRRVVFNTGIAAAAIKQKAHFSTQSAWAPAYLGEDAAAGTAATAWLENTWFGSLDLSAGITTWPDWLELMSKCIDRDGESFTLLTVNPDDDSPALLMIPAYQVRHNGEDGARIRGGQYDGATLEDGIARDDFGRPLFYRVHSTESEYEDIPAASIVHLFERDFPEQIRGYPSFAASLSDILTGLESKELELLRQLICSQVLLLKKGSQGPQPTDAGFETVINAAAGEAVVQEKVGPGIHYLKSGESLEAHTQSTPGDLWERFQTRLWREAVVGAGWSYALVRVMSEGGQGTVERGEIVRARLAVTNRIKTLKRGAMRFVTYGLTDKRAPRVSEMLWDFSRPARLSVDDGREDRAALDQVKAGAMAEEDFQASKGQTLRAHYVKRARAKVLRAEIAAAHSTPEIPITAADLEVRADAPAPAAQENPEILLSDD